MIPEKVRPKKFPDFSILYNGSEFAVAWGVYDNKPPKRLAMRWNSRPKEPGFPKHGKSPTWFMLPEELSGPILKALLGTKSANNQQILEALANCK